MNKQLKLSPSEVVIMTHVLEWVRHHLEFCDRDNTWRFIAGTQLVLEFDDLRYLEDVLYKERNTEFQ